MFSVLPVLVSKTVRLVFGVPVKTSVAVLSSQMKSSLAAVNSPRSSSLIVISYVTVSSTQALVFTIPWGLLASSKKATKDTVSTTSLGVWLVSVVICVTYWLARTVVTDGPATGSSVLIW